MVNMLCIVNIWKWWGHSEIFKTDTNIYIFAISALMALGESLTKDKN